MSRRTGLQLGDAALAIDPISSSGVQKAIQTALSGAIVANTLLRRPGSTEAALGFYRAQLGDASERHRRWAAGHYREVAEYIDRPFWRQRAGAAETEPAPPPADRRARAWRATPVELSRELEFVAHALPARRFCQCRVRLASSAPRRPAGLSRRPRTGAAAAKHCRRAARRLQIAQSWSNRMPLESGMAIAGWLVTHGILVEQHGQSGAPS